MQPGCLQGREAGQLSGGREEVGESCALLLSLFVSLALQISGGLLLPIPHQVHLQLKGDASQTDTSTSG